jgi:hypothetical protein
MYEASAASHASARSRSKVPLTIAHPRLRIDSTEPTGTLCVAISSNWTTGQTGMPRALEPTTSSTSNPRSSSTWRNAASVSPI